MDDVKLEHEIMYTCHVLLQLLHLAHAAGRTVYRKSLAFLVCFLVHATDALLFLQSSNN